MDQKSLYILRMMVTLIILSSGLLYSCNHGRERKPVQVECENCDGQGFISTVCDECFGKGRENCNWCAGTGKEDCARCKGSGREKYGSRDGSLIHIHKYHDLFSGGA